MLRLRHQVTSDENWVALLADENSFGRTRQELNSTIERNQLLGRGHVAVAGADDLTHARNTLGSIGEGGNGLRPTHAVELTHAEKCRSSQSRLGRARRHHANLQYVCNLRRNHG